MAAGERIHEQGRQGAYLARLWLDRTGRARIDFDAYNFPDQVVLAPVAGRQRGFDLAGRLLDEHGEVTAPLYVEVKYVTAERDQPTKYRRYLANCYSVTAREIQDLGLDRQNEFMWLTWHPFWLGEWRNLTSPDRIEAAVEEYADEVLDGRDIDADIVRLVAERCWMVVLSQRHAELSLADWMLAELRRASVLRPGNE